MEAGNTWIGFVDCLRLHVHAEPNLESEVVCKLRYMTEVAIDRKNSTEDFYKVYTAVGAEGFCQKEHIVTR